MATEMNIDYSKVPLSRGPIVCHGIPDWVTPEIAEQMADQVVAAVKEAGYPDIEARSHSERNWYFINAPDEVVTKAGRLVSLHWGIGGSTDGEED